MKPDLSADALKVAVQVVNELCYADHDDDPYGWLGSPTWELNSWSGGISDKEPYYSIKIRFESWRLQRENIENILSYLESVDGIKHHDCYFGHDQPFMVTVELPAVESGQMSGAGGDTA